MNKLPGKLGYMLRVKNTPKVTVQSYSG